MNSNNINDKDVTLSVGFGNNDDEYLPVTKCVCGEKFASWDYVLSIYRDIKYEGYPKCKRRLYFRNKITIYEVVD